ncbi:hypothetical protein MMC07_004442 [Pseudocyphellaria aurata]|nr:hypothetical protein [Pseudocyphellaria aurata]
MDTPLDPAVLSAIFILIVYLVGGAVYRLYLSPIAKFPGPKLAALTLWYEFYFDVVKRGRYSWEIAKMHEHYGNIEAPRPIVRINPYEIHINDPEYIDDVYPGSSRRTMKWDWAAKMFATKSATLSTISHELHRTRRGSLASFFSKSSVQQLEPVVQSVVKTLVLRLQALKGSGTNLNVLNLYSSLTGDIISQYAFGRSYNFLDTSDFAPHWSEAWLATSRNGHLLKQFGWLEPILRRMPAWMVKYVSKDTLLVINMQKNLFNQVVEVQTQLRENRKITGQKTIFTDVLLNEQIRPEEKTAAHLAVEANVLVGAGTTTTAHI